MMRIAIDIQNLETYFDDNAIIHHNLNLKVFENEVIALVGGSGSGKTTLLREILLLHRPNKGRILLFGEDILTASPQTQQSLRQRWGMMFQSGALFSGLNILENVSFALKEFTHLSATDIIELAYMKLALTNFPLDAAKKYPSELSGGMIKRAAVARALARDPQLLFLDEPTAGLDPITAMAIDQLILELKNLLKLTIVVVTHDIDTLYSTTDRIAFLGKKTVIAVDSFSNLQNNKDPLIHEYFSNARTKRFNHTQSR